MNACTWVPIKLICAEIRLSEERSRYTCIGFGVELLQDNIRVDQYRILSRVSKICKNIQALQLWIQAL